MFPEAEYEQDDEHFYSSQVRLPKYVRDSLEDISTLFIQKRPFLSFHLGTNLKKELTVYCFVSKAPRIFLIPTKAEQTDNGEHFVDD